MGNEMQKWTEGAEVVPATQAEQAVVSIDPKTIRGSINAIEASGVANSIGHNVIEGLLYIRGALPWDNSGTVRPWSNADDSYLFELLQTKYTIKEEKTMLHALTIICNERRFNPIIDVIHALPKWDGVKRVGTLFHSFLGAEDNAYTRAVETLFLSGIIMRTFHPGTKFDNMPVLIGKQGIGKSTFPRLLALCDEFFTDCIVGIGKKEGAELVQGRIIVEMAELDAIKGKDLETVKAFITRTSDDYRAPYAKRVERRPRRFVLIGTTNSNHFLRDASGNRRFLPVRCGVHMPTLDLFSDDARAVFAQVWAEMLVRYEESGCDLPLVLPVDVYDDALGEQVEASLDDTRIGEIEDWLNQRMDHERVCISQICELALDKPRSQQQPWYQNDVREIMERHFPEWEELDRKQRVAGFGVQRVYQRRIVDSLTV